MTARGVLLALGVVLPALLGAERPEGLGDVTEVRHWSHPNFTRVVVELSRPVETEVKVLPGDPEHGRPPRLYFDMEDIWVGRRFPEPVDVGDGLLRGVRLGQNTLRRARVVLDLEAMQRYRFLRLTEPDRLVMDVFGARDGEAQLPQPPSLTDALHLTPRLPMEARPIRTVVVDAGHGGRDPGAIGAGGLAEKDVTLRLARMLQARLESSGFRVLLTRDGDHTVSLEERTAAAEGAGGDLFLSIHANAAPRRSTRGIETYYLDEGAERQSLRVAARENGIPLARLDALQRTVTKLRVSEVSDHSALLARYVQEELVSGLRKSYRAVEDLGVKKGPFYVLFLSHMPSVLVEVGFLTHREEARRLRDSAYLESIAERIARAVSRYREHGGPLVARGEP